MAIPSTTVAAASAPQRGRPVAHDSTLLFPKDAPDCRQLRDAGGRRARHEPPGRPGRDRGAHLSGDADPHESLLLNDKRGLLGRRVSGNPAANVSVLDLLRRAHRLPAPRAALSLPPGADSGTRAGWSPDGRTFYIAGTAGNTLQAIDVSDPSPRSVLFTQYGVNYHGVRVSDDGRRLYVANIGNSDAPAPVRQRWAADPRRQPDPGPQPRPQVPVLSALTWPELSIPQAAEPFTRNGHELPARVRRVRELRRRRRRHQASAPVGAARIINIDDDRHPPGGLRHPAGRAPARGTRREPSRTTPAPTAPSRGTPRTTARCRRGPAPTWPPAR